MAPLDETITPGQAGHLADSEVIAGKLNRVIDAVVDYGCAADGVTNDAANLILAVAAAVADNAELFLPAGTYFTGTTPVTTPTTSGGKLRIRGAGKGITRITRTAGSATDTITILLTGAALVELRDFTIAGPTGLVHDNESRGIRWNNTGASGKRLHTERLEITGTHDVGINFQNDGGGGRVELIDTDIEASNVDVTCYEGSGAGSVYDGNYLYARGGTWKAAGVSGADSVGLYTHPNCPYVLEALTLRDHHRYGVYENGTPTAKRSPSTVSACRFINSDMAQTKEGGISNFVGCMVSGVGGGGSGSSLNGIVNVTGGSIENSLLSLGGLVAGARVTFDGTDLVNTRFVLGGQSTARVAFKSLKVVLTDDFTADGTLMRCSSGDHNFDDVAFIDDTTTATFQAMLGLSFANSNVRCSNIQVPKSCRGTIGFLNYDQATGHFTVENSKFNGAGTLLALSSDVIAASVDGSNNEFTNSARFSGSSTAQQRLVRRTGVSPTTVASAATIASDTTAMLNYDTHVVTGSTTINTLSNPHRAVGIVRLVVAAAATWATGNAGNITPLSTSARTAGSVVTLLWEPTAAKWLEV